MTSPRGLHALARLHGVQTAYHDHAGRRVGSSPESLMAVLSAMGIPVEDEADIRDALARRRRELWDRALEPVVVAWLPDPQPFGLRLPAAHGGSVIRVTAALEDGRRDVAVMDAATLPVRDRAELDGRTYLELEVPVPRVSAGYHEMTVEVDAGSGERRHRTLLIAAPRRCAGWDTLPGEGGWGVFGPVYALWEEGERTRVPHFGLLDRLADGVAELGGGVVGTLPVLASFLDRPYDPSPYAPVSRLFWNELYVATSDGGGGVAHAGDRHLDPKLAMGARRAELEAAALSFFEAHGPSQPDDEGTPRRGLSVPEELTSFVDRNPRVLDYARFRALTETRGPWPDWPDRIRARDVRPDDYDPAAARYHLFAQWQAESQLAETARRAGDRDVVLYLDLPLGVHPHGYDVWSDRDQFATEVTVGAPPDPLAQAGQDWGFHPPQPEASRQDRHRYFITAVRKHLRFAKVLRLDHIMQLHRLFWVADDARDGVYVRYPHEELYAILSLESHRAGAVIVGEDLGTVPRVVRRTMRRHGVPGMYVVQFELRDAPPDPTVRSRTPDDGEALVPGQVRAGALASVGTHDTPTFAGWWTGRDAEIRAERGLVSDQEAADHIAGRRDLRAKLARGLAVTEIDAGSPGQGARARPGTPGVGVVSRPAASESGLDTDSGFAGLPETAVEEGLDVQEALYRFLGRSGAGLVLASVDDLWMETEPQNVPGTPATMNWRQRARLPLSAIGQGEAGRLLRALNEARRGRP
jgi:4-alpha-glucanotransferase